MDFSRKPTGWIFVTALFLITACNERYPVAPEAGADRSARTSADSSAVGSTEVPPAPDPPAEAAPDTSVSPPVAESPTYLSMENEAFAITPDVPDSLKGDGLSLVFVSDNVFECSESRLSVYAAGNGSVTVEIVIGTLALPFNCNTGVKKAQGEVLLYPLREGTYPLRIKSGDRAYEGKITRAGNRYTIDWPAGNLLRFTKRELFF